MKKTFNRSILILLAMTALIAIPLIAAAQAADPNIHGFIIITRGNQNTLQGVFKQYVNIEELGNHFGVTTRSLENGKSAMVGHLYFDKDIKPYKGKAFVKASSFFDFFAMPYNKTNDFTYRIETTSIPMFDATTHKYMGEEKLSVSGKQVDAKILLIKNQKYVDVAPIIDALYLKSETDSMGRLLVNKKRVERWLNYEDKVMAEVKDLSKATGKTIK